MFYRCPFFLINIVIDSALPRWGDWSVWSDCKLNCSGKHGGRVQSRSRTTIEHSPTLGAQTETEERPCNSVQFAGILLVIFCFTRSVFYTFKIFFAVTRRSLNSKKKKEKKKKKRCHQVSWRIFFAFQTFFFAELWPFVKKKIRKKTSEK
jgi:hypothetical protein